MKVIKSHPSLFTFYDYPRGTANPIESLQQEASIPLDDRIREIYIQTAITI